MDQDLTELSHIVPFNPRLPISINLHKIYVNICHGTDKRELVLGVAHAFAGRNTQHILAHWLPIPRTHNTGCQIKSE